ncbi:efflux RND transporter periplasmic adaptor subunit [Kistimonas asteriae]|uniref:efflux RND transporter periplasmic adaptor subunit n=1 Tax=Kistimonas asteriae TaxID=517724 RepID=UPI001BA610B7|nr:efflux RND transporter periplasmic adaptor subunit [Kistimonas asteriae]
MTITNRFSIKTSLALAAGFSLLLAGCSDDADKQQAAAPAPAVSVVKVENRPVGDYREFVARTEAVEEVDLRARVEGYLTRREFIEGDRVEKGQLLFEIDPAPFKATISQAKANLSSSKAELIRAEKALKRGRELFPKGFISQSDVDTLTSNDAQARASVQARQAELETAMINLSYTRITAPFSGEIGKARYSVGNLVGPSSEPLAVLTSTDPMYVSFSVNDKDVVKYLEQYAGSRERPNDFDLSLRLPTGGEFSQPGTFNFANTRADETTGTINMRAEFPNPENILLPGLYVTLIAESKEKTEMPLIPQAAVQENQQGRFVLVVTDDNKIETRMVDMGRRLGAMWVVNKGLKMGERIVVEGLQKVRPGLVVNPVLKDINMTTGTLSTPAESSSRPTTAGASPEASAGAQ